MSDIKVPEFDLVVDSKDKKFYVEKPDSKFSVQRNLAVINETLEESEKFLKHLNELYADEMDDRADILGSYAKYRFNRGDKDFESYAGKHLYTRLIGEKILSKYKALSSVDKLRGKTKVLF